MDVDSTHGEDNASHEAPPLHVAEEVEAIEDVDALPEPVAGNAKMKQHLTGCFAVLKTIFTDVTDCREENDYEEAELAAPHLDWRYSKEQLRFLETMERSRRYNGDATRPFLVKDDPGQGSKTKQEELFLKVATSSDLPDFLMIQLAEQIRNSDIKGALRSSILVCTLQPNNSAAIHLAQNLQGRLKRERNAIIMGIHGLHHGGGSHHDMHDMHHSASHNTVSSESSDSSSSSSPTSDMSDSNNASSSEISY